jgi:transcription-repair coupling factor (superfamily II helicase)
LPPPGFIGARSLSLEVGQTLDRADLTERLVHHGYLRVDQIAEPGEFAVRGALLDLYPTGADQPVRIDLLDEEIESLRLFDPETQRSRGETRRIMILPAREFPFDAAAIRGFRERYREYFPGEPGRSAIYRDISEALLPAGIEYYLPLFFPTTSSLLDYLPDDTLIVETEDALSDLSTAWQLVEERYEQLHGDVERPLLAPAVAFFQPAQLTSQLTERPTLTLSARAETEADDKTLWAGTAHPLRAQAAVDLDRIDRWLASAANERTLLVASSPGRREVLIEFLKNRGYDVKTVGSWQDFLADTIPLGVAVGELESGLRLPKHAIRVITAAELGMERPRQQARRRRAARDPEAVIRELTDLRIGAPVVHEDYGVGRYQGLVMLSVDDVATEFLLLEYADGDKLYVPVQSLHLVTRYTGAEGGEAPLHKLGTDQWLKARRKAAERARDVAAELLNVYAQRAARQGIPLARDAESYAAFTRAFPFEETDDQLAAIEQVSADLASGKPMDRVVCGDVGFGKTEVALRAAFVAAHAGQQVAVLVPTTLLAQQHHQTFTDRFADWPIHIELLSRFRNSKESRRVIDGLAAGTVDIVIGTHKLLQADIRFKNLGLVIVDEEHRFGVKHKERLKRLRAEVHMLTLTATPILQLAVVSIRPQHGSSVRVSQLCGDPHALLGCLDTAVNHVCRAKFGGDFGLPRLPTLIPQDGVAADHTQVLEATEGTDHLLGDAVSEVFLRLVAGLVLKWQHSDDGKRRDIVWFGCRRTRGLLFRGRGSAKTGPSGQGCDSDEDHGHTGNRQPESARPAAPNS